MEFKDFEKSLKRLEEIVAKLEEGELTLEESLKLFEEGTKLSRACAKQLNQAQRKVEMLVKDESGDETALKEVPFEVDGEDEE
jgi:exodeoxyribonuclease VII small subunit